MHESSLYLHRLFSFVSLSFTSTPTLSPSTTSSSILGFEHLYYYQGFGVRAYNGRHLWCDTYGGSAVLSHTLHIISGLTYAVHHLDSHTSSILLNYIVHGLYIQISHPVFNMVRTLPMATSSLCQLLPGAQDQLQPGQAHQCRRVLPQVSRRAYLQRSGEVSAIGGVHQRHASQRFVFPHSSISHSY